MKLNEIYHKTIKNLKKNFIENAPLEARLLISHVLKINLNEFLLKLNDYNVSFIKVVKIKRLINKRLKGKNIALITGKKHFYGMEFYVNMNVLIPRPETEMIIDIIKNKFDKYHELIILDIGTGSGNIAIVLAAIFPNAKIEALDVSKLSLKVVAKNLKINKIKKDQIIIYNKDILKYTPGKKYDIIVSNPPYILREETRHLLKKKIISDPFISLDGGNDGLDFYRRYKEIAFKCLKKDGYMIMEHGMGQRKSIEEIFKNDKFNIEVFDDYAKMDRIISIQYKG